MTDKRSGALTRMTFLLCLAGTIITMGLAGHFFALGQSKKSSTTLLPPPPPANDSWSPTATDSTATPGVNQTYAPTYESLLSDRSAYDLQSPSNVKTEVEYDTASGMYIIRTKLGDQEIATPFMLTPGQYSDYAMRQSMGAYFNRRNSDLYLGKKEKEPFNILDMNFALGPLEKIFGPGGVQLKTQGSIQISAGIKSTKTDNPSLSLQARRKTYFDFQQKIQANINASVGDRMKFAMTYNTDATFDFDSKNLTLSYEGKEDDIVKSIEAGNVSMTTGSSLIKGSAALFGIKSKLQFGKLTATTLISQQNSESQSVSTKGGVQTTSFSINADEYDANRHFFLGHFFRDNYDTFAAKLPYVSSGVQITRIEVWVTNKSSNFSSSRNIVAFEDLGESSVLANDHWVGNAAYANTCNDANDLLSTIKSQYADARNINNVTQVLSPLDAYGIEGGSDYEKIESARLLSSSEYTLNSTLGYLSVKTALNTDEVLAVAYEYTYHGQSFKVGEFSSDISSSDQALFVKMLKSTTTTPKTTMWKLMMKNVYSLGAYSVQSSNFKLNIKYLSDTTGLQINYLPIDGLNTKSILQVMNLDRLDSNQATNPDGLFDFIEGYTILSSTGKVIFPVVEPFGSHLEKAINNTAIAQNYVYKELYDSTLVVARQISDKNKFVLVGEYVASSGSQIRLNAMNVPRGSVTVTAGGVTLTENADYTVDYAMGIVTITNQSIIDSGQSISVSLESQSMFSTQRKTLLGLDLNYQFNPNFNIGMTFMHFSEKALTEKVSIGNEVINNSMLGFNLSYSTKFMWLTNLLNKIPTVNATAPSTLSVQAEYAQLIPHKQSSGSNAGSSYIDDFESAQSGIDLRSPYAWQLASTPYHGGSNSLFPESSLSNNVNYGKNRALLAWYYIDRMFTQRNSSLVPGYIASDLKQLSNPYVREVTSTELFPDRQLSYGESDYIQTLNLSFYPTERGPYNVDATDIDDQGNLLNPEKRWGGIMRKLDNTNFESANIEYIQFWMMNPFLDTDNPNTEGGDLYFNLGEISEDILKDGLKSYENGIPTDGSDEWLTETVWGRVSKQTSLTYAFDSNSGSRVAQDVGLDGLKNADEFNFSTYSNYLNELRTKLSPTAIETMQSDQFSPFNDPAGDNYHFYRGYDYDEQRLSILERYKHYNGVEGNALSADDADESLYQPSKTGPDVEDINQDNTLNEYERYFQYRVSIRPEDLVVGRNYIADKQTVSVTTRDGQRQTVDWYQFKIPLADYERIVGSISDFSTIRFARIFMTGFKKPTHLRFATLELVRGEWRTYDYSLNTRGDSKAEGDLDVTVVNIEENAAREPVNYVLPPGVSRLSDAGSSQVVQLNEQSMSLKVTDLDAGNARAVYRNTSLDLRNYKRMQMWVHAESLIDDATNLKSGELSMFLRIGTDIKNNYYEYEIPLTLTPHGKYNSETQRTVVWPEENRLDLDLQSLVSLKKQRNVAKHTEGSGVTYTTLYTIHDPNNESNLMSVMGNPTLSDIRVLMIGVRNNASTTRDGVVWVNELKVTDFDEEGGWAAKANVNLGVSDIATLNFGAHYETAGFGSIDQSLNQRRLDDYKQINFAVQADLGRFLPKKAKLSAPVYYSVSTETTTPKYNPLDQDVKLKDALNDAANEAERDSIRNYAIEHSRVESFSISNLKFDVQSAKPMPWDPANFTFNFSFNRRSVQDPTTEYENTNDYRGSFQYNWNPLNKGLKPFSFIKSKNKNLKFFKEWEFNYLPSNITFLTTMSRYYYEMQTRSEVDQMMQLPVSVSKEFLWDRQLNLTWNITKQLNVSFSSNTTAHVDETVGAVNKRLFPDEYKQWKDTVMRSILHMGTPWAYNQNLVATYRAPFSKIPVLDFLTASVSYNASYYWDRGAEVEDVEVGNTIRNSATWNYDGRINFEQFYNKIPYLKKVNQRFASRGRTSQAKKAKKFERTFKLSPDSAIVIKHNLRTKKIKVSATTPDNKPYAVKTVVRDDNTIEVTTLGDATLKFTILEQLKEAKSVWKEIGDHTARLAMLVRNVSLRYRTTRSMTLPLFTPEIGNIFGQTSSYGPYAPGLDFAFGFSGEDYIEKARERGWLITDTDQTSPAVWTRSNEFNLDIDLEPIRGLKIKLTNNRTDSHSNQIQFMYDDSPVIYSGSYTKTHCAIATSFKSVGNSSNGYESETFQKFLDNIPVVANRVDAQYQGLLYPETGFMKGNTNAGHAYSSEIGGVSTTSADVLIPAFIAAYSGMDANSIYLTPFPSLKSILPNWRITYDGLVKMGNLQNRFKAITLSHVYQCTYTVGSYSSYLNWLGVAGDLGFTQDDTTGDPKPSYPWNISSVAITEKFAPLIGVKVTLKNDLSVNAEYRCGRTLTLNTGSAQIVEASNTGLTLGFGYKIVDFNTVLKLGGKGQGISHDLTLQADFSLQENKSLIRRIESAYTQATSGTRTLGLNFSANYILSRRVTLAAYFDHQVNTPLISSSAYPTTSSSYGLTLNVSLAR